MEGDLNFLVKYSLNILACEVRCKTPLCLESQVFPDFRSSFAKGGQTKCVAIGRRLHPSDIKMALSTIRVSRFLIQEKLALRGSNATYLPGAHFLGAELIDSSFASP